MNGYDLKNLADFYADKTIVSDTILCLKTQKEVKIVEPNIPKEDILTTPETLYWYLKSNFNPSILQNTLFYITNGSQTSLKDTEMEILNDKAENKKILYSDNEDENTSINMYKLIGLPTISYDSTFDYTNKQYSYLDTETNIISNIDNIKTTDTSSILSVQTDLTVISGTTQLLPINLYNYYFIKNENFIPSIWNNNHKTLQYYGGILNQTNNGGWIYNTAYCKHLLTKSMFETIKIQLNNIHSYPYYFYSPIKNITRENEDGSSTIISNAQQIKYNIGILPRQNPAVSEDPILSDITYQYDSDCYNSSDSGISNSTKYRINTGIYPFGVYTEHIGLKRSKGLAWPLFNITCPVSETDIINTGLPNDYFNTPPLSSSFYDEIIAEQNKIKNEFKTGCITFNNNNLENTLYPELNRNNFNNLLFLNKPEICKPSVYNIPLIFDKSTSENCNITLNNTPISLSNYMETINYPTSLISYYTQTPGWTLSDETKDYNIIFLNLEKLYSEKLKTITDFTSLTLNWEVSQNLGTSLIFGYIDDINKSLTEQNIIFDLKTWDGAYSNIDTATLIQNQKDFINAHLSNDIVIGIQFSSIEIDKAEISNNLYNFNNSEGKIYDNINHTLKIKYLDLGKYFGSIEYEYRGIKNNSIYQNDIWTYTQSYTFKNKADFILFYYFYKHLINLYLIKFNKIWNNILLLKDDNGTIGTFEDALHNPISYFNGDTTSVLISYNSLVTDSLLWNGFCNDNTNIDNEFYSTSESTLAITCNPYGNMAWLDNNIHSDIIGKPWIPSRSNNRIENPLLSASISNNPSEKFGLEYNNSIKQLLSIYRPKYIDFFNMNLSTTIDNLYNSLGFTGGFILTNHQLELKRINYSGNIEIINPSINGYSLNYTAFNMDYGWGKNNYTFESIINANIPYGNCIN